MNSNTTSATSTNIPFRISASSYIIFVSTVFVVLFGYTGFTKLITVRVFAGTMWDVVFMRPYIPFLMYFVPLFELFIAALLCRSVLTIKNTIISTRKIGIYLSTFLMFAFSVYVGAMLLLYKDLPCGCGGAVNWLTWQQHLLLNIGLFTLGVVAIIVMKKNRSSIYY